MMQGKVKIKETCEDETQMQNPILDIMWEKNNETLYHLLKQHRKDISNIKLEDFPQDILHVRALVDPALKRALCEKGEHRGSQELASRVGRKAQGFLEKIKIYLEAYGSMISLVKSVDPKAERAFQALSMMIIVVTNKKTKEDILDETLEKLNRVMSELCISHDIHENDKELEILVKKTYLHTYTFSAQSSYYYLSPRWKRILKTVTEPPEAKVRKAAEELEKVMSDVRARCLILTQKRIEQMDLRLQRVEEYSKETHGFEQESAKRSDQEHLAMLEPRLRHKGQSEVNIECYRRELSNIFAPGFDSSFNNCYALDIKDFRSTAAFKKWAGDEGSNLLLVSGQTEDHDEMHCWLSPALLAVYDECQNAGELVLLFCCRQATPTNAKFVKVREVLYDMAYQVLAAHPELLRDEAISKVLPKESLGPTELGNSSDNIPTPERILLRCLRGRGRTWMFIDRIDCCASGHDRLLSTLAELMNGVEKGEKSDCLKVFLVGASDTASEFKLVGKGQNTRKNIRFQLEDKCQFIDQSHSEYIVGHFSETRQDWERE